MAKTKLDLLIEKELGRNLGIGESVQAQAMWENTGGVLMQDFAKQFVAYRNVTALAGEDNNRLASLVKELNTENIRKEQEIDALRKQVSELVGKLNTIQSILI